MSGFLGCISKQKIDRDIFEKSVQKISKNTPEKYSLNQYHEEDYQLIFAESNFDKIAVSPTRKRNNLLTISSGVVYGSSLASKKFLTHSPSKKISDLFQHLKEDFVDEIEGKYSCAIYNKGSEEVILVRDRFGNKSLYYYLDKNYLIFSSEIRPIIHFVNKLGYLDVDEQSVIKYFSFLFIPPPDTLFKQVHKLDAANLMRFDIKKWKIRSQNRYWNLDKIKLNTKLNESEIINETERLLNNSVRNYVKATDSVRPAIMLGGLDSTAIAIYLAQNFPLTSSYTVNYTETKNNKDVFYAIKAAKRLGITNTILDLDKRNILDIFKETVEYSNEPTCNTGILPYYYLAKKMGDKTSNVFNGNAAEMLFNCSHSPTYDQLKPLYWLAKTYDLLIKPSRESNSFFQLLKTPIVGDYASQFLFFRTGARKASKDLEFILNSKRLDQYKNIFSEAEKKIIGFRQTDVQNRILYFNYRHEVSNFYLNGGDMAASAAGVEALTPFVDRELAEFTFSLEGKWKINQAGNKYILKKIVAKYLGDEIAYRKSNQIVDYPYGKWIKNELKELFEDYLFIENEFVNTDFVKRLYSDHLKNKVDNNFLLNQIFQFQYHLSSFKKW